MDITRFESSTMGHVVPISGVDAFLNRPYSHFAFVPEPLPSELAIRRAREILDMLRSRASEPELPRLERDYIDRLLRGLY